MLSGPEGDPRCLKLKFAMFAALSHHDYVINNISKLGNMLYGLEVYRIIFEFWPISVKMIVLSF